MQNFEKVNTSQTTARLRNVEALLVGIERSKNRPPHLPGLVVFSGPSGYGKSYAAAYAANVYDAYYVELKSTWTVKYLLQQICKEMGLAFTSSMTLADLSEAITDQLTNSDRALIIDEFDYMVDKNKVDIARDLFEGSASPIILIGEELLPMKLQKWERTAGRVLEYIQAQPASLEDAVELRKLYSGGVEIADDLLNEIWKVSKGSVRRICVNLDNVKETALSEGKGKINLEEWGNRPLYTGAAPARRV